MKTLLMNAWQIINTFIAVLALVISSILAFKQYKLIKKKRGFDIQPTFRYENHKRFQKNPNEMVFHLEVKLKNVGMIAYYVNIDENSFSEDFNASANNIDEIIGKGDDYELTLQILIFRGNTNYRFLIGFQDVENNQYKQQIRVNYNRKGEGMFYFECDRPFLVK